jgi:hypothetical protein
MSRNGRRLLLVTGLAIAVLAVFSIYGDIDKMGSRLGEFAPGAVVAALALALAN